MKILARSAQSFASPAIGVLCVSLLTATAYANNYTTYAETSLDVLQQWYDSSTGLWNIATWFHSPQPVTTISDLAAVDSNVFSKVTEILANTHSVAPHHNPQNSSVNWFENYYDNEGWWALAWIAAYDLTKETSYLQTAMDLFDNMVAGWHTPCDGGIWWTKNGKPRMEINSIANELFCSVGSYLANRVTSAVKTSSGVSHNKEYYVNWAQKELTWFQQHKFIGSNYLVNGRLNATVSGCPVEYDGYWTYTQGVIIGALIELNKAAPDASYMPLAKNIALASLKKFSDSNGVLADHCEPDCNINNQMFKGIFMRNLQYLQSVAPDNAYVAAIKANAYSVWHNARDSNNQFGQVWSAPFNGTGANAVAQAAAMDALVAGIQFA